MSWNIFRKEVFISNDFKFNLCLIVCIIVHSSMIVFGIYFDVMPLMVFNIFSTTIYILSLILVKKHQSLVYYYAFFEIVTHSILCLLLIGNEFGFAMYFLLLVPLSYSMLHSIHVRMPVIKATVTSLICLVSYVVCFLVSKVRDPIYQSEELDNISTYIYTANIVVTFVTIMLFSVLFLLETEEAFERLNDKNKELGILANTDPLTGLFNRRVMSSKIRKLYEDYVNKQRQFSLVICDIDNFKHFNDTYGHDCGDVVLKMISDNLLKLTRSGDYICRWGGEEFLILLHEIGTEGAREVAERFRVSVEKMVVNYDSLNLNVSMTFGVAGVTEADSYNDLFIIADQRLYDGKNSGKNCVK